MLFLIRVREGFIQETFSPKCLIIAYSSGILNFVCAMRKASGRAFTLIILESEIFK